MTTLGRYLPFVLAPRSSRPQSAQASARRRAVAALASGAAGVFVLHVALALAGEYSRYVRDPVYADKERKLTALERLAPAGSPEVLFLGTSRTQDGFDAARAQSQAIESLHRPVVVFNWGVPSSGPVTHLLHFKRILADGHRPSLLLVEVMPAMLAELPDGVLEGRFTEGLAFEWSELEWTRTYRFPTERLRRQRQEMLVAPWYALRFKILGRLMPTALPFHLRYDWSRGGDLNGWNPIMTEEVSEEYRAESVRRTEKEYGETLAHLTLGEAPVAALRELLALASAEHIPAVLIRMPEAAAFQALYPPDVGNRIDSFLSDLVRDYGCRVYDARAGWPDDAFIDSHHLLKKGAGAFSERLLRELIAPLLSFRDPDVILGKE